MSPVVSIDVPKQGDPELTRKAMVRLNFIAGHCHPLYEVDHAREMGPGSAIPGPTLSLRRRFGPNYCS